MIQCFKLLKGIDRIDPEKLLQRATTESTRGHHLKLFKKRAKSEMRRATFGFRVVDDWNGLPSHVIEAETVNKFKGRLDKAWRSDQFRSV